MPQSSSPSFETGMLAFARSIQISEGMFFGTARESDGNVIRMPVPVLDKGVRGQSSQDAAENAGQSNPQSVEFAAVPTGCTGIELVFTARVLPLAMRPHACGVVEVGKNYVRLAKAYADAGGFFELALRYTWNIANARFAWRNRFQTDHAIVRVEAEDGINISFDPARLDLDHPASLAEVTAALVDSDPIDLGRFVDHFAAGLCKTSFAFAVTWAAQMREGQEIFPSQEYVREERKQEGLSRVYAKLPVRVNGAELQQASMHSQKIGAALRHIDTWHGDPLYGAIAVNPYGGVQETSAVLRDHKSKKSFYDLRKNGAELLAGVENVSSSAAISDDVHFVMANLVRGGVFGSKNNKKGKEEA